MPRIPGLGAAGQRRSTKPPTRADELADMVLDDHGGEGHRLGDFWRDGPAVLVFLRHYG